MFISIKTIWLPKAVDCECGKLESNLVSVISKIPTLFLIIGFNWPNFLGSELIIKWLTTYLFIFFSLNLFKCTTVSQGSISDSYWSYQHILSNQVDQMIQPFFLPYFMKNYSNKTLYICIKHRSYYQYLYTRIPSLAT